MQRENDNIAKRVIIAETMTDLQGLGYECKMLSENMGIPNVIEQIVPKNTIKDAIKAFNLLKIKEEMSNSRKVGDRLTDDMNDNRYLAFMPLTQSRIWIRYRARSIKGVKVNMKRSYTDLSCRFCKGGSEESQEHLEQCTGTEFERRNLVMAGQAGKVIFWRRMGKKIMIYGKDVTDT